MECRAGESILFELYESKEELVKRNSGGVYQIISDHTQKRHPIPHQF